MPQTFRVRVTGDHYPTEYTVEATNWAIAIARAIREWRSKAGKGSRTVELSIKAYKAGPLLREFEV